MRSKTLSILQTLFAIFLIALCILAAQWQFHRGQARAHQNAIILKNQTLPAIPEAQISQIEPLRDQWRTVALHGSFDQSHQLLIRNRYSQGRLGFEVLNLFRTTNGNFWIDRGWVVSGKDASTPPTISPLPSTPITISARIRSEDVSRQIEGSFFASLPSKKIENLASAQGVKAASFYLDLLPTNNQLVPLTAIDLPELSNGPHYAYALQWLFFALIIVVGRIAISREKLHRAV
jgi:surfeit locus 1 family protein